MFDYHQAQPEQRSEIDDHPASLRRLLLDGLRGLLFKDKKLYKFHLDRPDNCHNYGNHLVIVNKSTNFA
ncbi:MAG TPA: hypothetical protein VK203_16065 [Nostocaceae cyanobacterium]|nr:hypothetical protein [Nostocaceae cyanobacterium]